MAMCVHNCENGGVGGKEEEAQEEEEEEEEDLYWDLFGGFD